MSKIIFVFFISLVLIGPEAAVACQPCKKKVTRVCEEDQKRPVCRNVFSCTGGTCGNGSLTTFESAVFSDSKFLPALIGQSSR